MKVLYITNLASPYRVNFFNELNRYCDLTVLFERKRQMTEMTNGITMNLILMVFFLNLRV